jgi:ankyrin repeat protein
MVVKLHCMLVSSLFYNSSSYSVLYYKSSHLSFNHIPSAARCGCLHAIRMILAADKDSALIRNNVGNVALHNAVKIGNFAAVSALCGQNALSAHIQVSVFLCTNILYNLLTLLIDLLVMLNLRMRKVVYRCMKQYQYRLIIKMLLK